jgi:hypothetical protein
MRRRLNFIPFVATVWAMLFIFLAAVALRDLTSAEPVVAPQTYGFAALFFVICFAAGVGARLGKGALRFACQALLVGQYLLLALWSGTVIVMMGGAAIGLAVALLAVATFSLIVLLWGPGRRTKQGEAA